MEKYHAKELIEEIRDILIWERKPVVVELEEQLKDYKNLIV